MSCRRREERQTRCSVVFGPSQQRTCLGILRIAEIMNVQIPTPQSAKTAVLK